MRLVLQRVLRGSVVVDEKVVGKIGAGLVCLVGIGVNDSETDVEWACSKMLDTKLWPDESGKLWQKSVSDSALELLLVSQFTLHGYLKGNKPDFHKSMRPQEAEKLFDLLVEKCKAAQNEDKISTGVFGAMMQVAIANDGPLTITLDSEKP